LSLYQQIYTSGFDNWQEMRNFSIAELDSAKNDSINKYRSTTFHQVGINENLEHFYNISTWYSQAVTSISRAVRICVSSLESQENFFQNWATALSNDLNQMDELPKTNPIEYFRYPEARCDIDNVIIRTSPPSRRQISDRISGPYGVVVSWLIDTESMEMTLITGMLGFGLLGAASSTVIREQRKSRSESEDQSDSKLSKPFVSNLSDIIIRGMSAAVVVFLAVEGGLAVFTFGDADPNPYVLMFTCLVGAVYSEVIWKRAREYLEEQLGDKEEAPEGPEGADEIASGTPVDNEKK